MIKKLRVTVDGKAYDVTVEMPDESGSAAAAPSSAPVFAPVAAPSGPKGPATPGDVPSPLSGRVVAVDAQVGQEVKEGDKLVTVETMKMNTFICAPKAGKVAEVFVAVGDTVDEGLVMVRLA
jgi:biotin carboxyl carrier protein